MEDKHLLGAVRKAIEDFDLIQDGDRIAVGVSGGKDSLTLMYALSRIKKFLPRQFDLIAIMVDLGFKDIDKNKQLEVKAFCEKCGVPLTIVHSQIGEIVFERRKEPNPCSLCATLRRGALNNKAKELNCNKVALAHSMDDFIETFMLSLVYEGRLYTMPIESFLTNKEITVIRPLFYVDEKQVISYSKDYPILTNPCPANKHTQRQYIKELIEKINIETSGGRERMKSAVIELVKENWKKKKLTN